jgi:hypothetical protein
MAARVKPQYPALSEQESGYRALRISAALNHTCMSLPDLSGRLDFEHSEFLTTVKEEHGEGRVWVREGD